jgi:hypothetical protein
VHEMTRPAGPQGKGPRAAIRTARPPRQEDSVAPEEVQTSGPVEPPGSGPFHPRAPIMAEPGRSFNGGRARTSWCEVRGCCPVCGHAGWCRVSPDGDVVACRRERRGSFLTKSYADGGEAHLHRLSGAHGVAPSPPLPPTRPNVHRAADADLDRVYRVLLALPELALRAPHRDHLLGRGLAAEDMARDGYGSLPACCRAGVGRQLLDRFPANLLSTIPGLVTRNGRHGRYLTLACLPGLLVPVRSAAGLVVGLVVRPDDPGDGGKYRWFSGSGGPSSGRRVHVPAGVLSRERAVLVEGTLKANVVHALSRRTIIGLPGCEVTAEALEALRILGVREALLALDADASKKLPVAQAQLRGLRLLEAHGFRAGLVRWELDAGKGLDDYLLARRGTAAYES